MKVAIIGSEGYVGTAYKKIFPDAICYDIKIKIDFSVVKGSDLAIVCVPTPTAKDGMSCDTSIVKEMVLKLDDLEIPYILIKSTVSVGTTEELQLYCKHSKLVFSPEYVGEGGYFVQFWNYPHPTNPKYHDFVILGGDNEATKIIAEEFLQRIGPHIRIFRTNSRTAELIKYTENMFIATKVVFCNEMYNVCKALGVDWIDVREGWLLDTRVSRMFTAVFTNKRGFDGKCLPKDTKALIKTSKENGYDPLFLDEVINSNERIRKDG